MNLIKNIFILTLGFLAVSPVLASDFDGSKPLICATVEARDCVLTRRCFTGEAREVGAPEFMRIDFAKKTITGTERTTAIAALEKSENQLLMQGAELGFGWTLAIDQTNGYFSGSITNLEGTFLLFGSCTLD
ncbi:hypothetical protein ACFL00_03870 [Pseudomonadota bacterium]